MTLTQFEAHRPTLGRMLRELLSENGCTDADWAIEPQYADGIRFVAKHPEIHTLVCVGPDHPNAMIEEAAPGCQGTWWWEEDLLER